MLMEFDGLSTPLVADACVRAGVPLRVAPLMPCHTGRLLYLAAVLV